MEAAGVSRCRDVDTHNAVRRIVVEHSLSQRERVKHIVHQNCRPLSATGYMLLSLLLHLLHLHIICLLSLVF